jgi:hypothetical protein
MSSGKRFRSRGRVSVFSPFCGPGSEHRGIAPSSSSAVKSNSLLGDDARKWSRVEVSAATQRIISFDISEIEADGDPPLKAVLYTAPEADVTWW